MPLLTEFELASSLIVLSLGGEGLESGFGANCVVGAGSEASVVVDPLVAPAHARLVEDAIRRRSLPPVRWVIATHHHTDHVLGAAVFTAAGARLVAHREAAARMAAEHPALIAQRRGDPALRGLFDDAVHRAPDVEIDGPLEIDLGGRVVEVRPLGHAHSPGDCAVIFRGDGVACCGDVVLDRYHFNYEDADATGVRDALAALEQIAGHGISTFVPGHGRAGGKELLEAQLGYHREMERIMANPGSVRSAREAVRARWPGWRLEPAISTALALRRE